MSPIDRLSALFEKFPGIGPRQARRFVQYLLVIPPAVRQDLAEQIRMLGTETAQCKKCYRWFTKDRPLQTKVGPLCEICTDEHRDRSTLFVVEKDADIDNVERSNYKGLYFVLGGTIPLAADSPEKHIRIKELLARTQDDANHRGDASMKLREVILGLSATTEGDHTRQILQEKLKNTSAKISSLGRGLSTGSELEYADPDTIGQALENRH